MSIHRAALLALALRLAVPCDPAHATEAATAARLVYAAYAAGLNVLRLAVSLELGPDGYKIAVSGRTVGTAAVFYRAEWTSAAQGNWSEAGVAPKRYESRGISGGTLRRVLIDYVAGNPVLRVLDPAHDGDHTPVPPELQPGTIDTLSAITLLIRHASATGRCETTARVFDGRRLSSIAVHTAGRPALPPSGISPWQGTALECDFDAVQTAGSARDIPAERARRPQHWVAWLAAVTPGGPLVPVRVQFPTRWFGAVTVYLTGSFAGPLAAPAEVP